MPAVSSRKKVRLPVSCKNCHETFYVQPFYAGRREFCGRSCSSTYAVQTRWANHVGSVSKVCERCSKDFCVKMSAHKDNKGRFCSRKCLNDSGFHREIAVNAFNAIAKSGTSIENALENILIVLNVAYEPQKPILKITVADFFVEPDLVIFADGDYWHALSGAPERDATANEVLRANGYRVVRFSETRINTDLDMVRRELVSLIENGDFYACHQ